MKVSFLDANKTYLGETSIAPVGVFERLFQTGLKEHATSGELPRAPASPRVVVDLDQRALIDIGINQAYNSAFADNISLHHRRRPAAPPDPTPPVSAVGELDHVFMVYMENKGYDDILGSPNAPFINSLINACGFADNYYGLTRQPAQLLRDRRRFHLRHLQLRDGVHRCSDHPGIQHRRRRQDLALLRPGPAAGCRSAGGDS